MSQSPVQAHFDRIADGYSRHFNGDRSAKAFEFATRRAIVAELLGGRRGRLLDCACGSGEVTAAALSAGTFHSATCVDISGEMLELARVRIPQVAGLVVDYVPSDIFRYLESVQDTFDVILCVGLIAHTGRLGALLTALKRVLAPDGRVILQTSIANHPGTSVVRALTRRRQRERSGYDLSYFTLDTVASTASAAGLTCVAWRRHAFASSLFDAVSPRAGYHIERALAPLSSRFGSEAIVALEHSR